MNKAGGKAYEVRIWKLPITVMKQRAYFNDMRSCFRLMAKRVKRGYHCDIQRSHESASAQSLFTFDKCVDRGDM